MLGKDEVKSYNVMYECVWTKFKKENPHLIDEFWTRSKLDPKRPLNRLVPRASVRGGFNEVYKLKFESTQTNQLYFYDCNGLYAHVARNMYFPIGEYQVILEPDIQKYLKIENNKFSYNGEDCSCDMAFVSILAPRDLMKPFLGYRMGEQNYYGLCFSCIRQKKTTPCRHKSPYKRRFVSTYTVIELEFALKLGYEIMFIYELYHYPEKAKVLTDFVQIMSSQKLKCTNLFNNVAHHDRVKVCNNLNQKMFLTSPKLMLTPANVSPNESQKQFFKDILNSVFGRFALNSNYSKRVFIRSQFELDALIANREIEILEFFPVSDDCIEVEYVKNAAVNTSREGNLFYTALINAKARIFIYELLQRLENDMCEVIYCDTDSLLFSAKPEYRLPFDVSPALGDFKPVLPPNAVIKTFYSLGCKNYCLLYKESDKLCYVTKIKGLSVTSHNLAQSVTPETYDSFIKAHFEDQVLNVYIPQSRAKVEPQTKSFKHIMLTQKFSNELHLKRYILKREKSYITYPYGFNFLNVTKI